MVCIFIYEFRLIFLWIEKRLQREDYETLVSFLVLPTRSLLLLFEEILLA